MEHLCPECNQPMCEREFIYHTSDYYCNNCDILYSSEFTSSDKIYFKSRLIKNYSNDFKKQLILYGTFEECCRLYKLRVFS